MSNCIVVHQNSLVLKEPYFDVKAFHVWWVLQKEDDPEHVTGKSNWYWFLKRNTEFGYGLENVTILVGQGHSSHTWRDFRWLVWELNWFFREYFQHTFMVSDESDGFNKVWPLTVKWPYGSLEVLREKIG